MGNGVLRYKGYYAKPAYDPEDQIIYGKILGIDDLVDFYSENAKDVEKEFQKAVDDYLDFCKEIGKEPQKAYSGSFNVRIPEELHREASLCAQANDMTLNSYVEQAIRRSVEQEDLVDKVLKTAVIAVATTQANQNLFSSQYQPSPATQVYDTTAKIDHIWSLTESHSVHTTRGVSQNA